MLDLRVLNHTADRAPHPRKRIIEFIASVVRVDAYGLVSPAPLAARSPTGRWDYVAALRNCKGVLNSAHDGLCARRTRHERLVQVQAGCVPDIANRAQSPPNIKPQAASSIGGVLASSLGE